MKQAQFYIRRDLAPGESREDVEQLLSSCAQLQDRLTWRLQELDKSATVDLEPNDTHEVFKIEYESLTRTWVLKEILAGIEKFGLENRASRIAAY